LQFNSFHALGHIYKIWFNFVEVGFSLFFPRPPPEQCPAESDKVQLGASILDYLWFNSFLYSCATLCTCIQKEQPVGRPLKRRLPPVTVQVTGMTDLSFNLDRGELQERYPVAVWQAPHEPMRKLQELLEAVLWQPKEMQEQVK
jgi:hypothetical protein